jgi:hyperosmotically inducible protein
MFNVTKQRLTALVPATILLFSLGAAPALLAQAKAPDNSGTNKTQNQPVTADQQKNDVSDRGLTAKIRRSVIADKSLSMYAHNVKIIVVAGAVTLKGPVRSDAEKQTIEKKATDIVGAGKVTNDITVKQ